MDARYDVLDDEAGIAREFVTGQFGFVTGCQMANFTCLAAARHGVLRDVGWDVEARGLQGAPEVVVLAGEYAHVTVSVACRMLGLGADRIRRVAADEQGRMLASELEAALRERDGPTIVCARAGEVNSGAFDPIVEIVELCDGRGAWCLARDVIDAAAPSHVAHVELARVREQFQKAFDHPARVHRIAHHA